MITVPEDVRRELEQLLDVLPQRVADSLRSREDLEELLEVVLDLGRPPEARFSEYDVDLDQDEVAQEDLDCVVQRVGDFGGDHRAGIERTLHRISSILNRKGRVVGITCRVGRAVFGTIKIVEDLAYSGKNILLLGRPGVGKTTMLREMARVLSAEGRKRVIIVDTSNEIAGDGDVPHPAIGRARRIQVPTPDKQHGVMIEAVENHMPGVIIIDEMGTEQEAAAARTIAERGVQLVATAHGNTLDNLIMNPTLSDLVGGVQTVTLGDQEARYRGTQKSVLERKGPPTFDVVVEILDWERLVVHDNVSQVVDQWLRGFPINPEIRWLDEHGQVQRDRKQARSNDQTPTPWDLEYSQPSEVEPGKAALSANPARDLEAKVFLFGIGRDKLEAAVDETGISVQVAGELRRADMVLTTKTHYRRGIATGTNSRSQRQTGLRHAQEHHAPGAGLSSHCSQGVEPGARTVPGAGGGRPSRGAGECSGGGGRGGQPGADRGKLRKAAASEVLRATAAAPAGPPVQRSHGEPRPRAGTLGHVLPALAAGMTVASFIVFEGLDGSGKSTQARALYRRLRRRGYPVLSTREPGGTPLGEVLRRWLKGRRPLSTVAELSLFVAARAQLVREVVRPALDTGITVVADRYAASTVAYQGYGRELDLDLVRALNRKATGGLIPDLTVLLDLPAEAALKRKGGGPSDAFETAPSDFHARVRQGYLAQAAQDPDRWLVLDAAQPQRALSQQVWTKVQPLL